MTDPGPAEQAGDPMVRDGEMSPALQAADPVATDDDTDAGEPEPKKSRFPTPLWLLIMISIGVWLLALVLPSGVFDLDDDGRPIPGSFQEIDSPLTFGESLSDLVLAPVNGFYGMVVLVVLTGSVWSTAASEPPAHPTAADDNTTTTRTRRERGRITTIVPGATTLRTDAHVLRCQRQVDVRTGRRAGGAHASESDSDQ